MGGGGHFLTRTIGIDRTSAELIYPQFGWFKTRRVYLVNDIVVF